MSSGERRICRQVDQHWTSRLRNEPPPTPTTTAAAAVPPILPTTRHRPCRCRRRRFHWCHSSRSRSPISLVPDRTTSRRRCRINGCLRRDCKANRITTIGTILISTTITTTIEGKTKRARISLIKLDSELREGEKYVRSSIFERKERQKTKHTMVCLLSLRIMFKVLVCCTIHFTL